VGDDEDRLANAFLKVAFGFVIMAWACVALAMASSLVASVVRDWHDVIRSLTR
jgi:hypothetical protein